MEIENLILRIKDMKNSENDNKILNDFNTILEKVTNLTTCIKYDYMNRIKENVLSINASCDIKIHSKVFENFKKTCKLDDELRKIREQVKIMEIVEGKFKDLSKIVQKNTSPTHQRLNIQSSQIVKKDPQIAYKQPNINYNFSVHDIKPNNYDKIIKNDQLENIELLNQALSSKTLIQAETDEIRINDLTNYTYHQRINSGGFASVYKCKKDNTYEFFALKVQKLHIEDEMKLYFHREKEFLRILDHPNIIKLKETVINDTVLVLEYIDSTLESFIFESQSRISLLTNDENIFIILLQIIKAIEYLHSKKIAHRDLKLSNILIDSNTCEIKLIDFNTACVMDVDKKDMTYIMGVHASQKVRELAEKCKFSRLPSKDMTDLTHQDINGIAVLMYSFFCKEPVRKVINFQEDIRRSFKKDDILYLLFEQENILTIKDLIESKWYKDHYANVSDEINKIEKEYSKNNNGNIHPNPYRDLMKNRFGEDNSWIFNGIN